MVKYGYIPSFLNILFFIDMYIIYIFFSYDKIVSIFPFICVGRGHAERDQERYRHCRGGGPDRRDQPADQPLPIHRQG